MGLRLCETRWTGEEDCYSDEFRVIQSGGDGRQSGVALILDKSTASTILDVCYEGDRLMMVRLQGKQANTVIIQVYMPTSNHKEEEIDEMYDRIEELIETKTKGKDYIVVMGDWNAVVGEGREDNVVGRYGLGTCNERGAKLVEFCERQQLYITNTWFCQDKRRRYTWTKPGNTGRYQIDYILVKRRYWNSVSNAKTYPGADADSDHNPVVSVIRIKLKKVLKAKRRESWNMERLKDDTTVSEYLRQSNLHM